MTDGTLIQNGEQQFFDQNGRPLANGLVFMYVPNTSTPKTTWTDQGMSSPNTNPIILDGLGRCIIWGSGTYRQLVTDSVGNPIWDLLTSDGGLGPLQAEIDTLNSEVATLQDQIATLTAQINAAALVSKAAGDLVFNVSPTGNDDNDGLTSRTPWQTLQHAWNHIQSSYDLSGFSVTINVAPGNYNGFIAGGPILGQLTPGNVLFVGNTTSPDLVTVTGPDAVTLLDGSQLTMSGMTLVGSGSPPINGNGVNCQSGSTFAIGTGLNFGLCSNSHMVVSAAEIVGGGITYSVTGDAKTHWFANFGGQIYMPGAGVAIATNAFSNAFALAIGPAFIEFQGASFGLATGKRFVAQLNGVISHGAGANNTDDGALPGTITGTVASGGRYD